jgi:ABC-type phosphate/phosphonate transport system substrate-binding protein
MLTPVLFLLLLGLLWPGGGAGGELRPAGLQIGMSSTLMRDVPDVLVRASARPLQALIETQTSLKAEFSVAPDADSLAERMAAGKTTIGVFSGCEFAWVRQKNPKLSPLVVAVNGSAYHHALILVRHDDPAKSFSELEGRIIAVPTGNVQHCQLFFDRSCKALGTTPDKFFSRVSRSASVEEALDEVVDGQADAAIIDGTGLDCYLRRKPGRGAQIRELVRSETFPAPVVAYHVGAVDDASLKKFRDGLLGAKQTPIGRQALVLWRLTGFETVPKDFDQTLTNIAKAYPRPEPKATK